MKLFLFLLIQCALYANEPVAFIKNITGSAHLQRGNTTHALQSGEMLFSEDRITTNTNTTVGISFNDGTRVALGSKTLFVIQDYLFEPSRKDFRFNLEIPKGSMVFESGKIGKLAPEKVMIKAPQGIIGIRGTKFIVKAE